MTPLVADQMEAAAAFVSLETNVQPEKPWPSNKAILFVGVMAASSGDANTAETVAIKSKTALRKTPMVEDDFMRGDCPHVPKNTTRMSPRRAMDSSTEPLPCRKA